MFDKSWFAGVSAAVREVALGKSRIQARADQPKLVIATVPWWSPVFDKYRPDRDIPPALFHPGAVPEQAFLAHPKALAQFDGCFIFGDALRVDAVQADRVEPEIDNTATRFDGVALTPMVRIQLAPEFSLAVVGGGGTYATASDKGIVGP